MNTNINWKTSFLSLISMALITNAAFADHHGVQEKTETDAMTQSFNLSELSCWDVTTLDEAERGTVLFLYYGYVSGVKGELEHDGETIKKVLTQLGEHCNENPDDKLLELMTKEQ